MGIADLMEDRIDFLNSHELFNVTQPTIDDITTIGSVKPNSIIIFNSVVQNADRVFLASRNNFYEKFQRIEMFDDGGHSDGNAGDGVFGAQVNMEAGEIQYYIYAENDQAAIFSPQRAEHEYYKLSTTAPVVINEFMASNDRTVEDNAGEYDDWLELYNNTEDAINLSGYYLSDKTDNLTKWQFPDTSINAAGFLVIWADEDSSQGPTHANFKLSADGEGLFLSDNNENVLDQIGFAAQETDISYGRYPDGTGYFRKMQPTFNQPNVDSINNLEDDEKLPKDIILYQNYPNPFNNTTKIRFYLNIHTEVSLNIYDVSGRKVRSLAGKKEMEQGFQQLLWDGYTDSNSQASSGIYFAILNSKAGNSSIKMLLIK
jgi:hypothetical protein